MHGAEKGKTLVPLEKTANGFSHIFLYSREALLLALVSARRCCHRMRCLLTYDFYIALDRHHSSMKVMPILCIFLSSLFFFLLLLLVDASITGAI